jgi:hypothetical protein
MKIKVRKLLFTVFAIINIFSFAISPVLAGFDIVSIANPVQMMDDVFEDLGVDKSELQNTIKTVNVSRRKKNPPQVSLTFDPANPVPGEKVAVTAMPTYFINTTEDLYFTWYIRSKRCDSPTAADKAMCDLNNDGSVNIKDYKIKATRILVNNDYLWDQTPSPYSSHSDNDGYSSAHGGDDQRGKENPHCYIHDVNSGDEFELGGCDDTKDGHLFPQTNNGDTTGDGTFGASEEEFWHTNPNNNDTAGTGNTDEANVAGLGENIFTFTYTEGDMVGVAVEGSSVEPTQYQDASYKTMWAFSKNKCEIDPDKGSTGGYPKTTTTGPTTYTNTKADHSTTPGVPPVPYAATDYTTTVTITVVEDIVPGTQVNDNADIRTKTTTLTTVTYVGTDPDLLLTNPVLNETTLSSTCPSSLAESGGSLDGYVCVGSDAISDPNNPINMTEMTVQDLNDCLISNLVAPSEGGGATEKLDLSLKYTPENPINDPSTNKNGDELSFTASAANATNISYLNYTWEVFASNEPNPDSWGAALTKTDLDGATQTSGLGIDTLKFNLNFTSPKKYLKVMVTAKDTVTGGEREGHANVVVPIFSSDERIKVYTAGAYFKSTDLSSPPYIKLADEISSTPIQERCLFEDPADPTIKTPQSTCEVAKDELIALEIDNADDFKDILWTIDGKTQICPPDPTDSTINKFDGCVDSTTGMATSRTYFPILKEPGSQYNVTLSALNKTTGEKLDLARVFKVYVPEVQIIPVAQVGGTTDTCLGLFLGNYQDIKGTLYKDRSDTKFQALTGSNIEIAPKFYGTTTPKVIVADDYSYQWNVDGKVITIDNFREYGYSIDLNNYGKIILPPKDNGEVYLISFSTTFATTTANKQVLNKYWNTTYNEFYEKKLADNIEIEMVSTGPLVLKDSPTRKIFATVSSGIPSYIAFLFRIALSGSAIILALKIIFHILPKTKTDEF